MSLLWTDTCFLLVLLLTVLLVVKAKPHTRAKFKLIFAKPIPAASAVVLCMFLAIGVLDSIHLQAPIKSETLLDRLLYPLGENYERTYSEPLALNLYTTEMQVVDGAVLQVHPQLKYPAQHIHNNQQKTAYINTKFWQSLILSLSLTLGLGLVAFFRIYYKNYYN